MFRALSIVIFLMLIYERSALRWSVSYSAPSLLLHMTEVDPINITINGLSSSFFSEESKNIRIKSGDENLAAIQDELHFNQFGGLWIASVNVSGVFLGEF